MIGRMVVVVSSCLVSMLFASLLASVMVGVALQLPYIAIAPIDLRFMGLVALYAAPLAAIHSAPFAIVGAAYSEWTARRSASFYAVAGALSGIASLALLAVVTLDVGRDGGGFLAGRPSSQAAAMVSAACGMAMVAGLLAGLLYWRLAGRNAGDGWRTAKPTRDLETERDGKC
jgi:hypothetical protein